MSATFSGFVAGDTSNVVTGTASLTTTATTTSGVGDYPITASLGTLAAANYDFPNFAGSTLTITKTHLTVTASSTSSTYGSPLPAANDQRSRRRRHHGRRHRHPQPEHYGQQFQRRRRVSGVGGCGHAVGGELRFPQPGGGELTVNKAPLTVSAVAVSLTYGELMPPLSAAIRGFVDGDSAGVVSGTPSLSTTATSSSGAGVYPIDVGVGTLAALNYDFTNLVGSNVTVSKAHLTVTANDASINLGVTAAAGCDDQRFRRRRHAGGRHGAPRSARRR